MITLLERYWTTGPMPGALVKRCGRLLDADPARMLGLLLAPERAPAIGQWLGRRAVRRRLAGLPDEELGRVDRAVGEQDRHLLALLRAAGGLVAAVAGAPAAAARTRLRGGGLCGQGDPLRSRVAEARRYSASGPGTRSIAPMASAVRGTRSTS